MHGTFKIIERIKDEIEEAEEYLECAILFKTSHPEKAKLFLEIAKDECKHAEKLIDFKQKTFMRPLMEGKTHDVTSKAMWEHIHPMLSVEVADVKREIGEVERSIGNPY